MTHPNRYPAGDTNQSSTFNLLRQTYPWKTTTARWSPGVQQYNSLREQIVSVHRLLQVLFTLLTISAFARGGRCIKSLHIGFRLREIRGCQETERENSQTGK